MSKNEDRGFSPSAAYCFNPRDLKRVFYGDLGTRAILAEARQKRRVAYVDTNYIIKYIPTKEEPL